MVYIYIIRCILQFVPYNCKKHKTSVCIYIYACMYIIGGKV